MVLDHLNVENFTRIDEFLADRGQALLDAENSTKAIINLFENTKNKTNVNSNKVTKNYLKTLNVIDSSIRKAKATNNYTRNPDKPGEWPGVLVSTLK